jgi:hypothetical protein
MATVRSEIQQPFLDIASQINTLVIDLKSSINSSAESDATKTMFQNEIRQMKYASTAHDTQFEEEEAKLQASGKKTRQQTLQEFVLLFFFCSYSIFTAAICLYSYLEKGMVEVPKILGILFLLGLVIAGLIIRLA